MTNTATLSAGALAPLADLQDLTAAVAAIDGNLEQAAWSAGYIIGYCAGISDDSYLVDEVMRARSHRWAATYDLHTARARWELLGNAKEDDSAERHQAYLRACGLLVGWKQSTRERGDASECGMCEARLLMDSDGVRCEHGDFCDEDCQRAVCGGRCYEPEFDDDAYYSAKYGA